MNDISNLEQASEKNFDLLEQKNKELETIRKDRIKGAMIRSRVNWIENGEKPTNYFCSLEKRNYTTKIIPKIENEEGKIISNQKEILYEIELFYKNLYAEKEDLVEINLSNSFENINYPTLIPEESIQLEGNITYSEATNTLKAMKNNKSPGSDGFTTEFLKFFWKDIGHFVVRSINFGYDSGELSNTQKQGIITCLPKGDKPRQYLKNWRPITLLNTIYKIAAGSIANRIKTVLPKLISNDQTGFISGRYIGENTRLTYDIMHYAEDHNIPGLLLLIDFEKAFDSISWDFIQHTLKFFKFGPSIQRWIKTFQKKISSAITQGGHLSSFFNIGRGCRQGDPIAAYCFILCAEILAIKVRNNKNIKGITINGQEILLSQYADDTCLVLDGSPRSLQSSLDELYYFSTTSGLKINYSKTQVIWIGSMKYSRETLCNKYNLQWGNSKFTYLGIEFDVDLHNITKLNYDKKLVKIKSLIHTWEKRILTPIGKITVIKTLLISQLNHLFLSIPNPNETFMRKLNTLLYNFLWNYKPDQVKREIIIKNYNEGGLKMIDVKKFMIALKSTWIRRLYTDERKWQIMVKEDLNFFKLANCGDIYIENCYKRQKNQFWKDVLFAWHCILTRSNNNTKQDNFLVPLWFNSNIKIGNKGVFYKTWYDKGIYIIEDVLNNNNELLKYNDLCEKLNKQINYLEYHGLVANLKPLIKKHKEDANFIEKVIYPYIPQNISMFLHHKKGTFPMYNILINNNSVPTSQAKWQMNFYDINEQTWSTIYENPFKVTSNTKLQWLQFRINHRILRTKEFLYKIGIDDDPKCTFCNDHVETIEHILWHCVKIKNLLFHLRTVLEENDINLRLDYTTFIFGKYTKHEIIDNIITLTIKQYIYRTKCQGKILIWRL